MNSYLLIGIESFIYHIGSIRDQGVVYWKKSNKKMQIGDIVEESEKNLAELISQFTGDKFAISGLQNLIKK